MGAGSRMSRVAALTRVGGGAIGIWAGPPPISESDDMGMIVRPVQPGDFEALAGFLEANNISEVTGQFHPFPLTEETARTICRADTRDRYFVVADGAEIRGLAMLRGWDEGFDIPSLGILIDIRYRGRGLGRRASQFVIDEARRAGCATVRLSVYASNTPAVSLYVSLGFVETNRHAVLRGEARDVKIVMTKDPAT